jgi:hypothetical protein
MEINVKEDRRGNQEWTIQKKLATLGAQDTGRIQAQQNTAQYVFDTTIC